MPSSTRLPGIARLAVRLLAPAARRDEVEGDLTERWHEVGQSSGWIRARLWLLWQLGTMVGWLARGNAKDKEGLGTGLGRTLVVAGRSARARPTVSLVVIGTIALAVAATTSVYTIVDSVLLRPLPYPDADRLVRVWQTKESWYDSPNSQLRAFADRFPLSVPTLADWAATDIGFEHLGAWSDRTYTVSVDGRADVVVGRAVTAGYFATLGVQARIGRHTVPADDELGATPVAVLGAGFWQERYGGDPGVLGTTIRLDGVSHEIVGVMPDGFRGPTGSEALWTTLSEESKLDERDNQWLSVVARLADGVSVEAASERLSAVQDRLRLEYPEEQGDQGARVQKLLDSVIGDISSTMWFLLAAVALVLVVATLNIANVLAVSSISRGREVAVRAALGAGRRRLIAEALAESAVLAGTGGVLGVLLAHTALPVLLGMLPSGVPRQSEIAMSPTVLLFGLGVTVAATLLVGVLPAARAASISPWGALRSGPRGATQGRGSSRVRSAFLVGEIAVALVLLVAAGLLGNSFARLWSVDRGFATEGLVVMSASPDPERYPEAEDRRRFAAELRDRLDAIPGVVATASNQVPLAGSMSTTTYYLERDEGEPEEVNVVISSALPNYMTVMEIPLVEGRAFTEADSEGAPLVAIANQALVDEHFGGEPAVGRRVRSADDEPWVEIVGVAANVRHQGLRVEVEPKLYVPSGQSRRATTQWVLRVSGEIAGAVELAREAVAAVSPTTPVREVQILERRIADSVAVPRFRTLFVTGLAGFAALLAVIGVYGVVAFVVSQRVREIGVRIALGARTATVVREIVGGAVRLGLLGVVIGLAIASQAVRYLGDFLFEVEPTDIPTFLAIASAVTAVVVLAAYVPARRAATVDPNTVLNSD